MKLKLLCALLFLSSFTYSQVYSSSGIYLAKEYNKDQALYKAKDFVMSNLIDVSTSPTKFEIDPLAAASSGELTSLMYTCDEQNVSGLVLGFFGDRWNESGVIYQAYAFKNLTKEDAFEILSKLEMLMDDHYRYLVSDSDTNNLSFEYDDMTFLLYRNGGTKIRVFWNGFDAEWEETAFNRTRRRFERKID
ncbi:hypothetical protein [uncultured Salegentibacter sp.]|uniref:hypothetical protein n=1 Tax=uncultured Salegentibacter sp. TaxID=259320 RepID=UPI002594AE2B|nr:hypothetical protein [uncultured Salegentibacter sp.]